VRIKGIGREKEIVISSVRMTLQLVLVGYILTFIFDLRHPLVTGGIVALMLSFAIYNIYRRARVKLNNAAMKAIALSMICGTLISLTYFILIVIRLTPWYEPRYFITIAGMIIGNSMTGISLGVNLLLEGIHKQKHLVEAALMLGATPRAAVKNIINSAFDAAILPTINSMLGMGIVFLPGMMTGQILSGVSPVTAIKYQIAIMLGIVGSVSLVVFFFLHLGYRSFFNEREQVIIPDA